MSDGYMQCLGTANELKLRFGEGYTLHASIDRKGGGKLEEVHDFIDKLFPVGKKRFADTFGTQVKYVIKRDNVVLWKVFEEFEKNKDRLKISDWAITETTLEEVFLKLSDAYVTGGFEEFKKKLKAEGRTLSFGELRGASVARGCERLRISSSPLLSSSREQSRRGTNTDHPCCDTIHNPEVRNVDPNANAAASKNHGSASPPAAAR